MTFSNDWESIEEIFENSEGSFDDFDYKSAHDFKQALDELVADQEAFENYLETIEREVPQCPCYPECEGELNERYWVERDEMQFNLESVERTTYNMELFCPEHPDESIFRYSQSETEKLSD